MKSTQKMLCTKRAAAKIGLKLASELPDENATQRNEIEQ